MFSRFDSNLSNAVQLCLSADSEVELRRDQIEMDEHTAILEDRESQIYNLTASHRQLASSGDVDSIGGSFGLLSKRDACSAAFGTGWINSFCAPGKTLCCTYNYLPNSCKL